MANVTDTDGFVNVTLPTTTDVALGANETNFPGKFFRELASRDRWLRDELESRTGSDATAIESFNSFRDVGQASIAQGRLTLATGDAVPATDQTARTTAYYTPYNGDLVALWNSAESRWDVHQFTERSLSLSGLAANANYDIFLFDNSGTLTLQAVGWSNSGAGVSTRASAISQRNGTWVKTSDDRRYLGTIRTTGTTGQCEDSVLNRLVFNAQNRANRLVRIYDATQHIYESVTPRAYRGSTANRINTIFGLPSNLILLNAFASAGYNADCLVGIGFNTTSTFSSDYTGATSDVLTDNIGIGAVLSSVVAEGHHYFQFMQATNAIGAANALRATYFLGGVTGVLEM